MLELERCVPLENSLLKLSLAVISVFGAAVFQSCSVTVRKLVTAGDNGALPGGETEVVHVRVHVGPKWSIGKNGDPRANRAYPALSGSISIIGPGNSCCLGDPAVFSLDARLQQDTLLLGDFPLCRLLLSNDANYPWFILVPRQADISEVFELSAEQQQQLWQETSTLAAALHQSYSADKMNIGALGNVVAQLHMHVIVRFKTDIAWPSPVWGKVAAVPYSAAQVEEIRSRVQALQLAGLTLAGDAS
jgi:diadenosine tetraphosphate (Ap4A) HIT family hydrolase